MKRNQLLKTIADKLRKQGAKQIAVFGSYARGEEKKNSDVDILVKFSKPKSLLEFVSIEQELSKETGKKVDLLSESAISPYLIDRIRKEMVKL